MEGLLPCASSAMALFARARASRNISYAWSRSTIMRFRWQLTATRLRKQEWPVSDAIWQRLQLAKQNLETMKKEGDQESRFRP